MLFGIPIQPVYLIAGGVVIGVLLVFELLVGLRKIKFKGKTHLKVHKFVAWAILALAVLHATLAVSYFFL